MIDMYIMIWHLKFINLKTILRPSIVGGMPLKRTHVVPSLNIECTPREHNRILETIVLYFSMDMGKLSSILVTNCKCHVFTF